MWWQEAPGIARGHFDDVLVVCPDGVAVEVDPAAQSIVVRFDLFAQHLVVKHGEDLKLVGMVSNLFIDFGDLLQDVLDFGEGIDQTRHAAVAVMLSFKFNVPADVAIPVVDLSQSLV